ncbi:hypothetical protein, partial [Chromobacterium violaceum]
VAAHQQAFVWIHKLLGARDNDEVIEECNSWAIENCLYLTSPARQAFFQAIGKARARSIYLKNDGGNSEKFIEMWHEIEKAFYPIVEGVELPGFNESDIESMIQKPSAQANGGS